ncbi:MAG: hypothetical protein HY074_00280 [Deltaproteobacteria bacterium]|nr:hypothetical protein [Deltaproteobacteria bacterium]
MAAESPAFSYAIKATPAGYALFIEMVFSPDVSLSRAVANLRDELLVHELYPNAEPPVTSKLVNTGTGLTYDHLLTISNYGLRTRMLSKCVESPLKTGVPWRRRCDLDAQAFDGGKVMGSKTDELTCAQAAPLAAVHCQLYVKGLIKDYLFISSAQLTVKAKAQALVNWGRFWYFTETGSISARVSNELFEHSEIAKNISGFTEAALKLAKKVPFDLAAQWHFEGQAIR